MKITHVAAMMAIVGAHWSTGHKAWNIGKLPNKPIIHMTGATQPIGQRVGMPAAQAHLLGVVGLGGGHRAHLGLGVPRVRTSSADLKAPGPRRRAQQRKRGGEAEAD